MAPNATVEVSAALPHLQIVDRLVELPLVNSAWGYANQRYAQLKSSSQLVNNTLDRAEGVFQLAVTTVTPVLNKIEQPIHYADNLAVQGLDFVEQKYGSIQKSGGELKDSTLKVVDQTKERLQAVKTSTIQTVQSKVQSVLTLPSNVVPLLDQILSAGENVLDYLLPEGANKGEGKQNGSAKPVEPVGDQQDPKTVLRLIIVRMRAFSDKVQQRIVDYSRDRWIPALFGSVVVIKDNLEKFVANGAAGKLLANGHSSTAPNESSNAAASSTTTSTNAQSASTKSASPKKNATSNSSSSSSPNGDAKKSTENESGVSS